MSCFVTLTNNGIIKAIDAAQSRVVLAASGIDMPIAEALVAAHKRLGEGRVRVVLDASANAALLGFGNHAAVELLHRDGVSLHRHEGLRICMLASDEAGWTFVRSPLLVEEDPSSENDAFNAITLTTDQVKELCSYLPHTESTTDASKAPEYPLVGRERLDQATVTAVSDTLKQVPPAEFDLQRRVRVYSAVLQFVELELEGFMLQSKVIKIPKTLPLIAGADEDVEKRLSTSFQIFEKGRSPPAVKKIRTDLETLRNAYLISVGKPGRVILKSKIPEFKAEIEKIKDALADFETKLIEDLESKLRAEFERLIPELLKAVTANPPVKFRGRYPITAEGVNAYVRQELDECFPKAADLLKSMKIHLYFKDVTYETLNNRDFEEKVLAAIPKNILYGPLFSERSAVVGRRHE